MQRLRRFARYWDLFGNSGNFLSALPLLWRDGASPFGEFLRLSDWIHEKTGRRHGIALAELGELLFAFLTKEKNLAAEMVAAALWRDYSAGGRSDQPVYLRPWLQAPKISRRDTLKVKAPKRQARHLA
jgi:hypothetical protein